MPGEPHCVSLWLEVLPSSIDAGRRNGWLAASLFPLFCSFFRALPVLNVYTFILTPSLYDYYLLSTCMIASTRRSTKTYEVEFNPKLRIKFGAQENPVRVRSLQLTHRLMEVENQTFL